MSRIFLAFANHSERPLPSLLEEDKAVFATLAPKEKQGHFSIYRDSNASIRSVGEMLQLYSDELVLFHFSGHAGRDRLLLEDDPAMAEGIASFLDQCPKLKLIVLNGCSTVGQVKRLLELKSQPAVIATSAAVEDKTATQFAIHFYKALAEQLLPIEKAFEMGISGAKLVSNNELSQTRDLALDLFDEAKAVWGLFPEKGINLQWKLPISRESETTVSVKPNEFLLSELLEQLAPLNSEVAEVQKEEQARQKISWINRRSAILKALPLPISDQLRKLVVPEQARSEHKFYDQFGMDRLRQILTTQRTVVELVAFTLLAQLWDALEKEQQLTLTLLQKTTIRNWLERDVKAEKSFDYTPLIRACGQVLKQNQLPNFFDEWPNADEEQKILEVCQFLFKIEERLATNNNGNLEHAEIQQLCIDTEKALAKLIGQLGFISLYTMACIKEIGFMRFRHFQKPRFLHKLVRLIQRFVGLEEEQQEWEDALFSASVILLKENKNGTILKSLNLSPFVVDRNSFDDKKGLAKLYYLQRYLKDGNAFAYKYVYKPEDFTWIIRKQKEYQVIKDQMIAFIRLIA